MAYRKLGRDNKHRRSMLATLTKQVIMNERIKTTDTRAKEIRKSVDKMITLGKKKDMAAYRQALSFITREEVAKKVFDTIAPKYADRNGGYTRVTRTGVRRGDAAETAVIELV
jgi:large subunit ribosomal protein L17